VAAEGGGWINDEGGCQHTVRLHGDEDQSVDIIAHRGGRDRLPIMAFIKNNFSSQSINPYISTAALRGPIHNLKHLAMRHHRDLAELLNERSG
jgi:hypothetical protein